MSITKELNYKILSTDNQEKVESIKLQVSEETPQQMYLIHRALKQQINNKRVRNAQTKTRSDVRGGGKKPWKQKGTGRARAGSNRSPLWRGGGVIFGPQHKLYRSKINKKEKRLAINTIISNKFYNTIVVENLNIERPNTKNALYEINKLRTKASKEKRILLIVENKTKNSHLSMRNIKQIETIEVSCINVLSLLKADTIIITSKALKKIKSLNN
uniref:Large ribosomal subunit protein uL4c n=1 Tax=Polysiphonia scopulorum TaxID=257860 RepID=A0A1Z1MIQ4_9FLOR|nr:ribosomal protein L4 [Polysiphonia scopulorum]ARW65631.1 ribosomal protein L4 [Polysiphonia scopulorum]